MRIPTGNFGNVIAEPQRAVMTPDGDPVNAALGRAGQIISGVADDLRVAEQQKKRAQAASTLATLSNELHDIHDQVGRDVESGTIKADQAVPEYRKRITERTAERTKDLDPEQRQLIDANLIKAGGTLERSINGIAIKRTQADTDANIMATGEQFQREAMRDLPGSIAKWSSVVDAVPHWDPTKKQQAKQKFIEGATYNFANATLEGAAQTGKIELVDAALEKLQGPDGEPIDPARRTALITKAYAYKNGIIASTVRDAEKAKRELEARENKAQDAYKEAVSLMLEGQRFGVDYINRLAVSTAGTSVAQAVQELVKSQAEVAGFATKSSADRKALIEQMRSEAVKNGTNPEAYKIVERMSQIDAASDTDAKENAWQAALKRGVIDDAPTINLSNVQDAQQIIGQRMQQINQVEKWVDRKISPLQPQEAEQIGRLVRMLPPDQQSSALASFGSMIGDADRVAALARQIDSKDKVLGTAMMFANSQTTQGRYVSELIIKGDRALRDKSIMVDNARETGWRGAIANEIGDAFPNQEVREKMIEAAYLVTAGMAAEGGADVARAVRMTAGRIVERNGSKIPLPYGMEEGDFEKRLSGIQAADLSAQAPGGQVFIGKTAVPLDQFVKSLPDAALVHAGQGRYNIRAGMGLVTNSQGKRITIEVRNAR